MGLCGPRPSRRRGRRAKRFRQGQDLVEGFAIGNEVGPGQLLTGRRQLKRVYFQVPANGGIGVVAQALDIADGDQEQIQSSGAVVAAAQVSAADQPVVHPAKARRDLPLAIRSEQMFIDHKQDTVFGCVTLGT